ncbi:hypothetical protein ACHWQZ_G019015 [Mnemiopsis leidyi]
MYLLLLLELFIAAESSSWKKVEKKSEVPFDTEHNVLQVKSTLEEFSKRIYVFTYPNIELTAITLSAQGNGHIYHSCIQKHEEYHLSASAGTTLISTLLFTPQHFTLFINDVLIKETIWSQENSTCSTRWSTKQENVEFSDSDTASSYYRVISMCDVQQLADYWTSTVNCSSPLIKGRSSIWKEVVIQEKVPFDSKVQVLQVNSTVQASGGTIQFFTSDNHELLILSLAPLKSSVYCSCYGSYMDIGLKVSAGTAVTSTFLLTSQHFVLLINNCLVYSTMWSEENVECTERWRRRTVGVMFYTRDTASEFYRVIPMCDVPELADYWTSTANCSSPLPDPRAESSNWDAVVSGTSIPFDTELEVLQVNSTMGNSATEIYFFLYPTVILTVVTLSQGGGSVYHSCNPTYTGLDIELSAPAGTPLTSTLLFTPQQFVLVINNVLVHKTIWSEESVRCTEEWSTTQRRMEFKTQDTASDYYRIASVCGFSILSPYRTANCSTPEPSGKLHNNTTLSRDMPLSRDTIA